MSFRPLSFLPNSSAEIASFVAILPDLWRMKVALS